MSSKDLALAHQKLYGLDQPLNINNVTYGPVVYSQNIHECRQASENYMSNLKSFIETANSLSKSTQFPKTHEESIANDLGDYFSLTLVKLMQPNARRTIEFYDLSTSLLSCRKINEQILDIIHNFIDYHKYSGLGSSEICDGNNGCFTFFTANLHFPPPKNKLIFNLLLFFF